MEPATLLWAVDRKWVIRWSGSLIQSEQ